MSYSFSGKTTLDDFIKFNKNYSKSIFGKKYYLFLIGILLVSIITIIIMVLVNKISFFVLFEIISNSSEIKYLVIVLFLILFFIVIVKVISPLIYKKYYLSNKIFNDFQNYIITENEIIISSETGNIILVKDKILKILYDKDSIYIYIALNMAYIIKARFFEDINQFNELRNFMNEKYKK